mmetsp:Transcript_28101/g.39728  ORF Transcript_28101/g.39728 Transcript_28101/m.39728 type:complete len:108 (+) Transcript_28101:209-532(+)
MSIMFFFLNGDCNVVIIHNHNPAILNIKRCRDCCASPEKYLRRKLIPYLALLPLVEVVDLLVVLIEEPPLPIQRAPHPCGPLHLLARAHERGVFLFQVVQEIKRLMA